MFYLVPSDVGMRYERDGDRLAVALLTSPEVFDDMLPKYGATWDADQPVVLLFQEGPASAADLFSAFDGGAAALAVIGPWAEGRKGRLTPPTRS